MNQQQILSALKLDANQLNKGYVAKLVSVCKLSKELSLLPGFKVNRELKGNLELVQSLPVLSQLNYRHKEAYFNAVKMQDNCKDIYGNFQQWEQLELIHNSGSYKFSLPANNEFFNYFLSLIGCEVETVIKKEFNALSTICVESKLFSNIGKAIKFVSKDQLRPVFSCVCIAFENYSSEVVSTDCYRLYQSAKFECSQKERVELLINSKDAKELANMNFESELIEVNLMPENKIIIEGKEFELFNEKNYPDYKVVIPEYESCMTFNKKDFISNVKRVLPSANKRTKKIDLHLNGSISFSAVDIDMSTESNSDMSYLSKDFKDADISFNGSYLLDAMGIFKNDTVKMFTEGLPTKGAIFTNDIDSVLIMPAL